MGVAVLVVGDSGCGKSASLRNFETDEVGILNVEGKPLPFKKKLKMADNAGYDLIEQTLKANNLHAYVIDDAGYLLQNENIDRALEVGYVKYTDMAQHFKKKVIDAARYTDKDTIVYIFMHIQRDAAGHEKPMTVGRLLDEKVCIEGEFTIVLRAAVVDGQHVFLTKSDGYTCAKAPIDMLPDVMDNDLKQVDTLIREYWDMAPLAKEKKTKNKE